MRAALGDGFYMQYFQAPGVADAELARDPRRTMRAILYSASGDAPRPAGGTGQPMVPPGSGLLDIMPEPETLPTWLTEADVDVYAAEFARTGFTGGLNWYRTIDLSWELIAPWSGARVRPPALFVAGDRDLVVNFPCMRDALPACAPLPRTSRTRSCWRAAGTGPSMSGPRRSTRRCSPSCAL
jgi:hypothetical protein